ncbi:MAG: DegT/DnrJ/EryC1/StrS family aminotransferase, partial [Spirochaetaceae bacterium]|nr:DegT/DnrJ/EryC1/StrS family aminotransferase [Spirochaetaceae bacterium]
MKANTDFIPFALPDIGKDEEEAVLRVLRSGWITTASEAKAFEEEFARYVGSPHALAVNSATAGLHLALEALGVGSGDRVITTPYTFTATAEV